MKDFVNMVYEAQAATGSGSKAAKRKALERLKDNSVAKRFLREAMSPYRVFGIKKFSQPTSYAPEDEHWNLFINLLNQLHERLLTGNEAKEAVEKILGQYTERTAKILRLVLLKDLKAGFSAETVNEVFTGEKKPIKDAVVPLFGVMLARKMVDNFEWDFPILAEAKYDGTRTIATCEQGVCEYFSRSGKPSDHLKGLFDEELNLLEEKVGQPIVIDGETLATDFTETMNAKGSNNDEAKANLKFYAFDVMTLDEWKLQSCTAIQAARSSFLESCIGFAKTGKIIKSKYKVCTTYEEVLGFYNEMLDEGFEGLIIKDLNSLYEWGRSKTWTKWKPVNTYDGRIVDFFEGKAETSWEGTLGGIVVEGVDENGTPFKAKCGSGFKLPERHKIWANKKAYLGKMVELEAQEMTVSESKDIASLRFPIFKKFRSDKDGL